MVLRHRWITMTYIHSCRMMRMKMWYSLGWTFNVAASPMFPDQCWNVLQLLKTQNNQKQTWIFFIEFRMNARNCTDRRQVPYPTTYLSICLNTVSIIRIHSWYDLHVNVIWINYFVNDSSACVFQKKKTKMNKEKEQNK